MDLDRLSDQRSPSSIHEMTRLPNFEKILRPSERGLTDGIDEVKGSSAAETRLVRKLDYHVMVCELNS